MGEGEVAGLTGVRHGDLADLIGVEPDLALAALEDARGEALLQLQRHHLLPPPPRGSSSPPPGGGWCGGRREGGLGKCGGRTGRVISQGIRVCSAASRVG